MSGSSAWYFVFAFVSQPRASLRSSNELTPKSNTILPGEKKFTVHRHPHTENRTTIILGWWTRRQPPPPNLTVGLFRNVCNHEMRR
ncbi:hypothetical protein LZ32DRAFT_120035 [Colletotrichum eremochloae]|nr:hypothetical protein LZ32DRAFT_120035 [Colletotrichum eremochloae]